MPRGQEILQEATANFIGRPKGKTIHDREWTEDRRTFSITVRQVMDTIKNSLTLQFEIMYLGQREARIEIANMVSAFRQEVAEAVLYGQPLQIEGERYVYELCEVVQDGTIYVIDNTNTLAT